MLKKMADPKTLQILFDGLLRLISKKKVVKYSDNKPREINVRFRIINMGSPKIIKIVDPCLSHRGLLFIPI